MIDDAGTNTLQTLSLVLQTLALGILLVCGSLIHIRFGSVSVSLMYLPAALLFFWPRNSGYAPAVTVALMVGLFQDLVSGGALGIWTLTYTALFIVIDPTVRRSRGGLISQWSLFAVLIFTVACLSGVLGRLSSDISANYVAVILNAVSVILMFPLLFGLRRFIYQLSGRSDAAWGR